MNITFVCRGQNPLILALVAEMKSRGHDVAVKTIPEETPWQVCEDPQWVKGLLGEIPSTGPIVTDETLHKAVEALIGRKPVSGYAAVGRWKITSIADVVNKLRPVVEEIRAKGKKPVVLQAMLSHHLGFPTNCWEMSDEEAKTLHIEEKDFPDEGDGFRRVANGDYYAEILRREFGIPVLTRKHVEYTSFDGLSGYVVGALEKLGMEPENTVLLADHHLYECRATSVGMDRIPLVPICPCCLGINPKYLHGLCDKGYTIFPLEYQEERRAAADELEKLLQQTS